MKKRLIVLLLIIGLNIPAFSQIPGHLGRRFFVTTDLTAPILDHGAHLSLEYLLFKGASLKVDYRFLNRKSKFEESYNSPSYKMLIKEQRVGVGLKKYIHKSIVKPPLGGYVEFDWAFGFASFTKDNIEYKNQLTNNWQLGGGYQYIIKRRLLLDIGVFLSSSSVNNNDLYISLGKYSANLFNGNDGPGFSLRTGIGFLLF